eukprot:3541477-Heterocapsa_arctica.AAC.1
MTSQTTLYVAVVEPAVRYVLSNDPNAEVVGSPRATDPTSTAEPEMVYEKGYPQIAKTTMH